MFRRIQSAISTAHAISLAIREMPDAIRECVEFARENAKARECPECSDFPDGPRTWRRAWKMLKKERRKWGEARFEMSRRIDILSVGQEEAESSYRAASTERNELRAQITEARELLSGLSSGLGYGLGGEDEPLMSMISRVEDGIKFNLKVMTEQRDAAQNKHGTWRDWACSFTGANGTDAEIRSAVESEVQKIITEAKARIATLVESDGKLRRENERLSTELSVSRSATADWRREHTHLKTQFDTVATEYARADDALQSANLEITRLKSDLEFWIRAKSDR